MTRANSAQRRDADDWLRTRTQWEGEEDPLRRTGASRRSATDSDGGARESRSQARGVRGSVFGVRGGVARQDSAVNVAGIL